LQTNLSYILLFCSFFFIKISFAQDIKSRGKTVISSIKKDTILPNKKDSLFSAKKGSLIRKNMDTISTDSIKPRESIEDIIIHDAKDYTIQNAKDKTVTLYNDANIKYTDIDLKAGIIIIDYKKNTLFAKGILDSTGYNQKPIIKQGN
jgi:hypothetical protein